MDQEQEDTFVFIHGAGMDAAVWNKIQLHVPGKFLALNLPGHGGAKGQPRSSIQGMGDWVAEYLRYKKPCILCGHSMGGLVALAAAAQLGEKVKALIMMGVNAEMRVNPDLLGMAAEKPDEAIKMILKWGISPSAQPTVVDEVAAIMKTAPPGLLARDLEACELWRQSKETARKVKKAALLIAGADDKMAPANKAENLAAYFAIRGEVQILPDTGHMMMLENPLETVKAIGAFMDNKKFFIR